ncbi:MAG: hypothetical protein ACOYOF_17950 [Verrucomicrobiaceae bacterium]
MTLGHSVLFAALTGSVLLLLASATEAGGWWLVAGGWWLVAGGSAVLPLVNAALVFNPDYSVE